MVDSDDKPPSLELDLPKYRDKPDSILIDTSQINGIEQSEKTTLKKKNKPLTTPEQIGVGVLFCALGVIVLIVSSEWRLIGGSCCIAPIFFLSGLTKITQAVSTKKELKFSEAFSTVIIVIGLIVLILVIFVLWTEIGLR